MFKENQNIGQVTLYDIVHQFPVGVIKGLFKIEKERPDKKMTCNSVVKVEGETTYYSSCNCNCGSDSHCVFKVHLKDGTVVAVEPDDRYNTGIGREDEVLSEDDLIKNRLQRRPCVRGIVFHKHLYHPDRVIYPLKRTPGARRGEGKFTRISWDEALTTVAGKMQEIKARYGPYSIIIPKGPNTTADGSSHSGGQASTPGAILQPMP